jgi:hypothetical protein
MTGPGLFSWLTSVQVATALAMEAEAIAVPSAVRQASAAIVQLVCGHGSNLCHHSY